MAGASDDHFRVLDRLLRRTDVNANGAGLALGSDGELTQYENTCREHERTHRPPAARADAPIPRFINCGEQWTRYARGGWSGGFANASRRDLSGGCPARVVTMPDGVSTGTAAETMLPRHSMQLPSPVWSPCCCEVDSRSWV